MLKRTFIPLLALPLVLGVAACDDGSGDYEDQIAELQEQLQAAENQASEAMTENEDLNQQISSLGDQIENVQAFSEDALEEVQASLSDATSSARTAIERLDLVGEGGLEQASPELSADLREDLDQLVQRLQTVASDLGLELEDADAEDVQQQQDAQ